MSVEGVTGLGGNELKVLSQRLEDARKARIEAQNIKEDVQGMSNASTEELMTVPAVLQHQLIRELTREQSSAERKVAELAKRYGPKHPKMIAAQSDLSTANEELAGEVRKVVSGISREYEIALRNEQQLQATWEASKTEVQDFNRKEFQLQELQREVDTNRELYDIFFTRIKSVSETGGFEKPHARIVDRAMVPTVPSSPTSSSAYPGLYPGHHAGLRHCRVAGYAGQHHQVPDDVQDKLGAPLLGTLPKMKLDKSGEFEQFWQKPQGQYRRGHAHHSNGRGAERPGQSGEDHRGNQHRARRGQVHRGPEPGGRPGANGKHPGDRRRPAPPQPGQKVRPATQPPGLTHFVSGAAKLDDCIEHVEELDLYVMPAGIIPPNPLEMISSQKFVQALHTCVSALTAL